MRRTVLVVVSVLFGTIVALVFVVGFPGQDGYGAPLRVHDCRLQIPQMPLGGSGVPSCHTSVGVLSIDALLNASYFVAIGRWLRVVGIAVAGISTLIVLALYGNLTGSPGDEPLKVWATGLVGGGAIALALSRVGRRARVKSA